MTNSIHRLSCQTPEHYTPRKYIEAVRYVLGDIDLDPASCEMANVIVQAKVYYDMVTDGLRQPWTGKVFVNPPGDKRGKLVRAFWRKANLHVVKGEAVVVWLGYSIEQLRTLQSCASLGDRTCPSPLEYPLCFPRERIEFVEASQPEQMQMELPELGLEVSPSDVQGDSPTQSNFIALLGGDEEIKHRFVHRFRAFGDVIEPTYFQFRESQYAGVCEALARSGPCTRTHLARALGIRRRRLATIINELIAQGIVCKRGHSLYLIR